MLVPCGRIPPSCRSTPVQVLKVHVVLGAHGQTRHLAQADAASNSRTVSMASRSTHPAHQAPQAGGKFHAKASAQPFYL